MLIVDTDVVSMIFKEDTRCRLYLPAFRGERVGISFMTRAETERWKIGRSWGMARRFAWEKFSSRFLLMPVTEETCRLWAEIIEARNAIGEPIDFADAWIAATALEANCPLMTNNARHFHHVDGLQLWHP